MQKRKSHNKSRTGCQNCKQKHVKCDEQGPPCANCVVRKIACVYRSPPGIEVSDNKITWPAQRPRVSQFGVPEGSLSAFSDPSVVVRQSPSVASSPINSLSLSPTAFSSIPESHRLLELELMHRWSTRTWMGLYSIPEDQYYLQVYLPRSALRASYLMNGILAIAAVDLARCYGKGNSSTYLRAALEYSNKASAAFRDELCDITQENLHLLYHFAMIAAIFNFAIPTGEQSAIDRMNLIFHMILGAYNVAWTNIKWLFESPCSAGALLKYPTLTMDIIDSDTHIALDRLTSVSRLIRVPIANREIHSTTEEDSLCSDIRMYQFTIAQLKYSFAEDAKDRIKGYCLSVIPVAGRDFALAIKELEPMALFIVMHFGVLLHRLVRDIKAWWTDDAGKDLVGEISEILQQSSIAEIPDGHDGIAWTRQQVGLPALV